MRRFSSDKIRISNSKKVMDFVPESKNATSVKNLDLSKNGTPTEKALGVQRNVLTDTFCFKIVDKKKPSTRRGILSVVCSVYGPLGFVSPCILPAKGIQQDAMERTLRRRGYGLIKCKC